RGVHGIRLRSGDAVVDMVIAEEKASLLTVCEHGYGKRTSLDNYRSQNRGGVGLINIKTTDRNGKVVALKAVQFADELMLITANGQIMRTGLDQIRPIGRNTQGVRLIKLKEGDKLVAVAKIAPEEERQPNEQTNQPEPQEQPEIEQTDEPEEVEEETAVEDEPEPQPDSQKTKTSGKPKSAKPSKAPKKKRK
ncbi:MAG: hypothetical protein MUO27_05215, partial [Sedimentisphaerales bacterium]|nr:hypothetical protein [Sedimentisphaerales bacterium]